MKINISAVMENQAAAQSLFNHLRANHVDPNGLGIADGSTVIASVSVGEVAHAAQLFYEFLTYR